MPVHAGDDLAVGGADVGGVEGTVEAQDQKSGNGLGVGAGGLEVLAVVGGLQLGEPDPVELDQDEQQGEQHPDEPGSQGLSAACSSRAEGEFPLGFGGQVLAGPGDVDDRWRRAWSSGGHHGRASGPT
jgi:hypothetical protein